MIRNIEKKDREEFIQMADEFYASEAVLHAVPQEYFARAFETVTSDSPYMTAFIIEHDGQYAGYSILSFTSSLEAGGLVVWLEELYVRPAFRGLGLGGALIDYVLQTYRDKAKRFRLEVSPDNGSVESLYERKGFSSLDYKQMLYDFD